MNEPQLIYISLQLARLYWLWFYHSRGCNIFLAKDLKCNVLNILEIRRKEKNRQPFRPRENINGRNFNWMQWVTIKKKDNFQSFSQFSMSKKTIYKKQLIVLTTHNKLMENEDLMMVLFTFPTKHYVMPCLMNVPIKSCSYNNDRNWQHWVLQQAIILTRHVYKNILTTTEIGGKNCTKHLPYKTFCKYNIFFFLLFQNVILKLCFNDNNKKKTS